MAWLLDQKEMLAWLYRSKCLRVKRRKMLQVNTVRDTSCEAPSAALKVFFFFHMIAILPTLRSDSLPQQIMQEAAAQEVPSSKWLEHPGDHPRMWEGGSLTNPHLCPCCSLSLSAVPSV